MKNPTLLKDQVTYDQAKETVNYLYSHECEIRGDGKMIRGYYNGEHVINYNSEYGNIMVSEDYIETRRKRLLNHTF